ncbi:MAG: type VI secretion system baseplate subunit TssG [Maricaulaceae bacterium]
MAAESGRASARLIQALQARHGRGRLFQILRLFEQAARADALAEKRAPPARLGEDGPLHAEPVRVAAALTNAFAAAETTALKQTPTGAPKLETPVLGLVGPLGVLPQHYTETALRQRRAREHALPDFLDLFHHRLVSLFYRAWRKYQLTQSVETETQIGADPISGLFRAIGGLYGHAAADRLVQSAPGVIGFSGHFARPTSAGALKGVLETATGLPVTIKTFQGDWAEIAEEDQSRLSQAYVRLGVDALAGARYWNAQSRFRVVLGPLDRTAFDRYVEPSDDRARLMDVIRLAAGPTLGFDVQLVLRRDDVPTARLDPEHPPRLGRTGWLFIAQRDRDAEEAVVRP